MTFPVFPTLICPVCRKGEFDRLKNGFLLKKTIYTCRDCHTRLEQAGQGQRAVYHVTAVSPDFTNCAALFEGMRWSGDELTQNEIGVYSDVQLAGMVQGDIPAEILEEAGDESPFLLDEGEKLIFALDNVFFFEDRLWKNSHTARFSFRETIGKWQTVKHLPEPHRRDITETLDNGHLYITSRRYSFTGMSHTVDEPFTKISLILPFQDGMGISRSNSPKMEFFKGGYHWPLVAAVTRGLIRRSNRPVDAPK